MRSLRSWAALPLVLSLAAPLGAEDVTIVYDLSVDGQPQGTAPLFVGGVRVRGAEREHGGASHRLPTLGIGGWPRSRRPRLDARSVASRS